MAIVWANTFDGPNGTTITPANSAAYGDPVGWVTGNASYATSWAAHGTSSVRLGDASGAVDGELQIDVPQLAAWSVRMYLRVPVGSWLHCRAGTEDAALIDSDQTTYTLIGQDVTEHAGSLVGRVIRVEIARAGATATARVWWTAPDSTGAHDLQVQASATGWPALEILYLQGGGFGTPSAFVDELAIGDGAWIGPVVTGPDETGAAEGELVIYGEADGRAGGLTPAEGELVIYGEADGVVSLTGPAEGELVIYGEADGTAGASVATGTPVCDMWIGPVGLLHRVRQRGEWERTPDLGADSHVSLHGSVTVSRARSASRTVSLAWDRLDREDADALEEIVLVPARTDAAITVVDPDAANVLTPEQSRGRPGPGLPPTAVEELYSLSGPGRLTVGLASGIRHATVGDAEPGTTVRWLHPYYGSRGWPVMPGWPVYMSAALQGGALPTLGRVWLTFYDHAGALISSAAGLEGTGLCEADTPEGAVTVSPSLRVSEAAPGLRLLGAARLSYAPQRDDGQQPLGRGCPAYAVTGYTDTPLLPWRSITLDLQEVRASAYR